MGTCRLGFVTIDESWHPFGIPVDYKTTDRGGWRLANGAEDGDFRTLGEWWGAVLDKGREGRDYLPLNHISEGPCVTVAGVGSTGLVLPNSVVGNCARGLVQAKSCALLPADISVELSTTTGHDISRTPVPGVQLRCDDAADVRIETNTGERIPMNGDSASVTVLDWGAGFGKPLVLHVPTNGLRQIALHVKTEGVGALPPGVISGSSIVNVTYE